MEFSLLASCWSLAFLSAVKSVAYLAEFRRSDPSFPASFGLSYLVFLIAVHSMLVQCGTYAEKVIFSLGLGKSLSRFGKIFDVFRSVRGRIARALFPRPAV